MALPTNFRDDILKSGETRRKYKMINNPDGTVSFDDVTDYQQVGSDFGAKQVNDTNTAVNNLQPAADRINNLEIGGRNLILNSGIEVTNNNYYMKTYTIESPLIIGETYTISMSAKVPKGISHYGIYMGKLGNWVESMYSKGIGESILKATFTCKLDTSNKQINILRFPNDGSVTEDTTIHWVKLEKGNIATDWTPAPEDIHDKTLGTLNEVKAATQKGFWVDALAVKELDTNLSNKMKYTKFLTNAEVPYNVNEYIKLNKDDSPKELQNPDIATCDKFGVITINKTMDAMINIHIVAQSKSSGRNWIRLKNYSSEQRYVETIDYGVYTSSDIMTVIKLKQGTQIAIQTVEDMELNAGVAGGSFIEIIQI